MVACTLRWDKGTGGGAGPWGLARGRGAGGGEGCNHGREPRVPGGSCIGHQLVNLMGLTVHQLLLVTFDELMRGWKGRGGAKK